MRFIIFCGDDMVGKSTMALSLQEMAHRGCRYKAEIMAWADTLRQELIDLYGLPSEMINNKSIDKNNTIITLSDYDYDRVLLPKLWKKHNLIKSVGEFKNLTLSLRNVFVFHATNIRRAQDPNYWVKKFDKKAKTFDKDTLILVDDTRFDTEFDYLNEHQTTIIHLTNSNSDNPTNAAQDSVRNWIANNPQLIDEHIRLDIPVLRYDADKINKARVMPHFPPSTKVEKTFTDRSSVSRYRSYINTYSTSADSE